LALSLSLASCRDTKTLRENEQLKSHVADLQKEYGQMGNNLDTVTAERDALAKENAALKAQLRKAKHSTKKATKRKRRRT
jgi:regulator of replication initiation timing